MSVLLNDYCNTNFSMLDKSCYNIIISSFFQNKYTRILSINAIVFPEMHIFRPEMHNFGL